MSKKSYRNAKVSKCQNYPNTQKCIEISNLDCIEMSKDLNVKFRCIEISKVSKCQISMYRNVKSI